MNSLKASLRVFLLCFIVLAWTGCQSVSESFEALWRKVQSVLSGNSSGKRPDEKSQTQTHAELLGEMHRVVFLREPEIRSEFGSYVDSMNQGASLEGVYNGFTHSSRYRRLEASHPGATPKALSVFGREMARLALELSIVPAFEESDTRPLALPVQPGLDPEDSFAEGVSEVEFKDTNTSARDKPDFNALSDRYAKRFVGASIFTLKRTLGDTALMMIAEKSTYKEKFALWYSQWVVQMAGYGVDFGLELRNRADADLHYRWALNNSRDRLSWEVLNRLHRLLNYANEKR